MPELPEVETVKRGLGRTVVGKTITLVDVRVPKLFADSVQRIKLALVGAAIVGVERRAKVLLIRLSTEWTLAIHLKMTGQIIVVNSKPRTVNRSPDSVHRSPFTVHSNFVGGHPEKAYEQPLPHKHTHVIITFTDGTVLYFNDLRKFGWMKLLPDTRRQTLDGGGSTLEEFLLMFQYGPEPLGEEFTFEGFRRALAKRHISIKTVLLDQRMVAGVGNIYADEALFRAKIKPTRKASALNLTEIQRLYQAIPEVLNLGIEHGGTTFNTYRNVEGTSGKMRDHLNVYGREGLPCVVCGNIIERMKIGQRSACYCLTCQR